MAKRVFQCENCPEVYGTENQADECNVAHSLEELADRLHEIMCHADHMFQADHSPFCGYLFPEDAKKTRREWLKKAVAVNKFSDQCNVSTENLLEFIASIIRG